MPATLASRSGSIFRVGTVVVLAPARHTRDWIAQHLEDAGLRVNRADTAEQVIELLQRDYAQAVLIDEDGAPTAALVMVQKLRANPQAAQVPIVVLSARTAEAHVVRTLEAGADDFITKPYSFEVMLARLAALLRRYGPRLFRARHAGALPVPDPDEDVYRVGPVTVLPRRHDVYAGQERLTLTFSEFRLLALLAAEPGELFTREDIRDALYPDDRDVSLRAIDSLVFLVRKKLGDYGHIIETRRGLGYRITPPR